MSMEIILIFRQINKIARSFNLECIPHIGNDDNYNNHASIINHAIRDPWQHYIQFRVSDSFINVIFVNNVKMSSRTGLNTARTIKSVSLGDPQLFAKVSKILKDWNIHVNQKEESK